MLQYSLEPLMLYFGLYTITSILYLLTFLFKSPYSSDSCRLGFAHTKHSASLQNKMDCYTDLVVQQYLKFD